MTFESTEYGLKAIISTHVLGYSVALYDVDADEYAMMIKIFPVMDDAITYAKSLVSSGIFTTS